MVIQSTESIWQEYHLPHILLFNEENNLLAHCWWLCWGLGIYYVRRFFWPTKLVSLSKKERQLVWHDLFVTNPLWLLLIVTHLSNCSQHAVQKVCPVQYRCQAEISVSPLHFPFLKITVTVALLYSSGISPIPHFSKTTGSNSDICFINSFRSLG